MVKLHKLNQNLHTLKRQKIVKSHGISYLKFVDMKLTNMIYMHYQKGVLFKSMKLIPILYP